MSLARKHAILSGGAWLIITVALFAIFFQIGPEAFATERGKGARDVIAMVILPGYLLNFAIIVWAGRGRKRGDIDERDKVVERKASMVALTVMLLVFFLTSVGLYEHFRESGAVPVGWLYLMAYGSIALVSLVHPVVTLFIDFTGRIDG